MRARGLRSPDRADAILGAMAKPVRTGAITQDDIDKIRIGTPDVNSGDDDTIFFNDTPLNL